MKKASEYLSFKVYLKEMIILSWKIKRKQIPYYVLQTYCPMKKLMEEVNFQIKN